ncbi:MAG TPA: hypothetical protein VIK81_01150 [Patescibacteria group bacterium]
MNFLKLFSGNSNNPAVKQTEISKTTSNNKSGKISNGNKNTQPQQINDFSWEESLPGQDVSESIGALDVGPNLGEGKPQAIMGKLPKRSFWDLIFSLKPKKKVEKHQEIQADPIVKKQVAPLTLPKSTAPQFDVKKPIKNPIVPKSVAIIISSIIILSVVFIAGGSYLYEPLRGKNNLLPIPDFIKNSTNTSNSEITITPTPAPFQLIDRRTVSWFVPIPPSQDQVSQTQFWTTLTLEFFEVRYPKEWVVEDVNDPQSEIPQIKVFGPGLFTERPISIRMIDFKGVDAQSFIRSNFENPQIQKITLDNREAFHLSFNEPYKQVVILPMGGGAVRIDLQQVAQEDTQIFNFLVASIKVKT